MRIYLQMQFLSHIQIFLKIRKKIRNYCNTLNLLVISNLKSFMEAEDHSNSFAIKKIRFSCQRNYNLEQYTGITMDCVILVRLAQN